MSDSAAQLFHSNGEISMLRRHCSRDIHVTAASENRRLLTERRGVIFGENLILGSVRVEEEEVIEIADAVSKRADGEVFGCVGHEVPHHPLTWTNMAQHQKEPQGLGKSRELKFNSVCPQCCLYLNR